MHELARFHYSRRRCAAEVFDFDRASLRLLARFRPGFGAIVQAAETADPFNAQREKTLS
ncbi:MAG: hypothetical protein RLZZ22_851 [Pseudomonadota bacterium]|jgi:hypothetical protein